MDPVIKIDLNPFLTQTNQIVTEGSKLAGAIAQSKDTLTNVRFFELAIITSR